MKNYFKKTKNKIKLKLNIYFQSFLISVSKGLNKPLNKPTSITVTVTLNCNSHCQHCHLWKTKPEKQMTFNQAKQIIDKLYDWLGNFYLFFTGGEPFLNQDLTKIIKYAQSKGITCHVNSNALLIDKNLANKIIKSKLNSISLSLDSAKASTNNFIRGIPTAYQKVIQAIKLLQNGPNIYLNTVIMKPNINELIPLIKLAQQKNTNGINFQCLLPTLATKDNVKNMQTNSLWPKYKNLKSQIKKIINLPPNQKHGLLNDQNQLNQFINYYKNPSYVNQKIVCAAGINNFIISKNGDVRLCFILPPIGNILKNTAKEIWLSQKAQQQRKIIRKCQKPCKITKCNQVDTHR